MDSETSIHYGEGGRTVTMGRKIEIRTLFCFVLVFGFLFFFFFFFFFGFFVIGFLCIALAVLELIQ